MNERKNMVKPLICIVDDDPVVLNALERDLRAHFKADYRIMKIAMQDSLDIKQTLLDVSIKKHQIALFIVDQRMPNITGIEFLGMAKEFFPYSKKCLLTAYADTNVAIDSINKIGLDYYFMKPWTPAEERLYPILDDLLKSWTKLHYAQTFEGIRVVGSKWSHQTHIIKEFLSKNQIAFLWQDIDSNIDIKIQLEKLTPLFKLPVIFFPNGEHLMAPTIHQLAEKVGLQTTASKPFYDLIVIGAGPAGLAAGVYGASEGLKTIIIDKEATGGQAGTSSKIENYLGFPSGISGGELAQRATMQAKRLGAEIMLPQEIVKVSTKDPTNILKIVELKDGTELACFSVIIATGVALNRFELPNVDKFVGAGIFYGASITEAINYKDKEVIVLGGGNSAGQGAIYFASQSCNVKIIIRRDSLVETMSQYLIEQIEATPNIELITNTIITSVKGEKYLNSMTIKNNKTNKEKEIPASALFIFIGANPYTEMVKDFLIRDKKGYIVTGSDLGPRINIKDWNVDRDPLPFETNIPGIFACGDVRFGSSKRVAAAVGEGSVAVRLVHEYLKTI